MTLLRIAYAVGVTDNIIPPFTSAGGDDIFVMQIFPNGSSSILGMSGTAYFDTAIDAIVHSGNF